MIFNKQICSFLSRFVSTLNAFVTSDFHQGNEKSQQPAFLKTQKAKLAIFLKHCMSGGKKKKRKITIMFFRHAGE